MYEFIDGGLSHSINSDETTPIYFSCLTYKKGTAF